MEEQPSIPRSDTYEHVEYRPLRHDYLLHRPRALQYSYRSQTITAGDVEAQAQAAAQRSSAVPVHHVRSDDSHESRPVHRTPEDISKHRERLDLFIDLIWVGIISNLSEVFSIYFFESENSAAVSTLLFLLVFLPSWRIWNFLREFLNNYYMDDMLQRFFIFWILVLSVFYGNNLAYFPDDTERVKTVLITLYLCIRASFIVMELIYSIWIPWLRRLIFFSFLVAAPTIGLWVAAIVVDGTRAAGPAAAAVVWEYTMPLLLESPLRNKVVPSEYQKEMHSKHLTARMGSFFIITVGEGVLLLIKDGPLGIGISRTAGSSVWALAIYFCLALLYFNRDYSSTYVPAVRHMGWRAILWMLWHVPLFASLLTLSAGLMFFIRLLPQTPTNVKGVEIPEDEIDQYVHRTIWLVAISLAVIMFSITAQALLDKSRDPPRTLLINNRYGRMAGRLVYCIIILCVPVTPDLNQLVFLGIAAIGLSLVLYWEWVASLERGGGFIEPQGLTVMMKKELRVKS